MLDPGDLAELASVSISSSNASLTGEHVVTAPRNV